MDTSPHSRAGEMAVAAAALDPAARLQPILAGGDDPGAGIEALLDHGRAVGHLADVDRLHRDGRVRLDDIDIHAVRPALDGGGRHRHDLRQGLQQQPDIDVLARPQGVVLVGKGRLEADAAGRLIDQVVDQCQRAFAKSLLVAAALSEDLERRRRRGHLLDDLLQLILRQGEDHRNRLQLRDDDEAGRVGRVDDVALVDQPDAGASRQRRLDRRVVELHLCGFDIGLVGLQRSPRAGAPAPPACRSAAACWPAVRPSGSAGDRAWRSPAAPGPLPWSLAPGRAPPETDADRSAPARRRP